MHTIQGTSCHSARSLSGAVVLNQFISGTLIGAGSKTILCILFIRKMRRISTVGNFSALWLEIFNILRNGGKLIRRPRQKKLLKLENQND
jgi:hypothetical protein